MLTAPAPERTERLLTLGELADLGYGSRRANQIAIREGRIPAVVVGRSYKVRESDLYLLTEPAGPRGDAANPSALAARLVSTWPRLTAEQKLELGRLLSPTS